MADKEATVYIVDVGKHMANCHNGRSISDLDYALKYIWDKITYAVSTDRKTLNVGVIGLKTDDTNNAMYKQTREEAYEHISVFQELKQTLLPDIRALKSKFKTSNTYDGDTISAIILAIAMIEQKCKRLKYIRRIVLVTDGRSPMDTSDLDSIADKIRSEGIELVMLKDRGVDFDDPEYGVQEEDKPQLKAHNETILKELANDCNGMCGTLEEAVTELAIPRPKKAPRPLNMFKGGNLMLGDYHIYDNAITISVERYFRTYEARPPTASAFVAASKRADTVREAQGEGTKRLAAVRTVRDYEVTDEEAPDKKKTIEREVLAMGYEYGRTAVPISKEDEHITNLETSMGLEIMGFISQDKHDRCMSMSNTQMVVASKLSEADALALSSIIRALDDLQCFAIARLVAKDGKPPLVVALAPYIEEDFECLTEVQLPFAEDVRTYRFPPLDKIITLSGKEIREHRNLPSKNLLDNMEEFVNKMELSAVDEEGHRVEMLPMDEYFSPVIHRVQQAIKQRAVDPEQHVPDLAEAIDRLTRQPEELKEQSKGVLEKLIGIAEVKKVPPRTKGRKREREAEKPLSGLDVESLLGKRQKKLDPNNAIPEYIRSLFNAPDTSTFKEATDEFATIIENRIRTSLGDQNYERAIEELAVMRKELIEYEEPDLYNETIYRLIEKIDGEQLNGDRKEMAYLIRKNKLGSIEADETGLSNVSGD
ncbi:ATP-dependent DNA helicase II subunit 2 [Ascosphaera pollenicola]|nr:ATP-dependent DNA helicase II subunit 2 [Ascosphaera pollenicola]